MNITGFLMTQVLEHTYRVKKRNRWAYLARGGFPGEVTFSLTGKDKGWDQRLSAQSLWNSEGSKVMPREKGRYLE